MNGRLKSLMTGRISGEMGNKFKKNLMDIVISVGFGGVFSIIIEQKIENSSFNFVISQEMFNDQLLDIKVVIMGVSLIILLLLPIMVLDKIGKEGVNPISWLLFVLGLVIGFSIYVTGTTSVLMLILFSSIIMYFTWVLVQLAKYLYTWLIEDNTKDNVSKITLIWTIVAFILGVMGMTK